MGNGQEVHVEDLQQLIFALTQDQWQPSEAKYRINIAYRGLSSDEYPLETGLARLQAEAAGGLEQHLLRNFKKYAHRDATPGDSLWNWLSVAQHHGLPTRLLDWTFSPYVALHFATSNPRGYGRPGVIWCVDYVAAHELLPPGLRTHVEPLGHGLFTTEILTAAAGSLEAFDEYRSDDGAGVPLFFEPPSLDDRIVNQSAVFSIMTDPEASLADWLAGHPGLYRKVVFPAELKWAIRNHLDQANVTERVLLPGLDGLCRWLARYYGDRPEQVYPDAQFSPTEAADPDSADAGPAAPGARLRGARLRDARPGDAQ